MHLHGPSADRAEKLIGVAGLFFVIELVLFKFLPDISTAVIQHAQSSLASFTEFQREYLAAGSVHHARFLGNYLLYGLASLISSVDHSLDPRLHPLRVAAGVLTPCYVYIGLHPVLTADRQFDWRYFLVAYGLATSIGLYIFYPADAPSLGFLSLGLFCLLNGRLAAGLILTLVTGLFRESAFHMVWLVAVWTWCDSSRPVQQRLGWLVAFGGVFVIEYVVVRHFFPGPVSSAGGIILDPRRLFLDKGLVSATALCSIGLAALYPIACWIKLRAAGSQADWRVRFFELNCYAFPGWLLFYRMMNGNLSELRMLFPALLPCMYGMAYAARRMGSCNGTVTAPH